MEESNEEKADQPPITHFSHPHPLQLLKLPTDGPKPPCAACKFETSGPAYTCSPCNFSLHPKCYQLPQQINHPFDKSHALYLHPKPVYPQGQFICAACFADGDSFSYHCSTCRIDLHPTCASLPLKLSHKCHIHDLTLTFSVPYPGGWFLCDLCNSFGSKAWFYRCKDCEFHVDLTCSAMIPPAAPPPSFGVNYISGKRQDMLTPAVTESGRLPPFSSSAASISGLPCGPPPLPFTFSASIVGSAGRPYDCLGNEEEVAGELLLVRAKAPHPNVEEEDAKIHREEAVCKMTIFSRQNADANFP